MLKRFFQFRSTATGSAGSSAAEAALTMDGSETGLDGGIESPSIAPVPPRVPLEMLASFAEIYQTASLRASDTGYTILKIADMVNSSHLRGIPADSKKSALMMALDAAAVAIEDVLQDAVQRQRALNDYEQAQQKRLAEHEGSRMAENARLEAEMERVRAQYRARIEAGLEELSRERENLSQWQQRKDAESQRISDAASFCVPQGSGSAAGGRLPVLLERTVARLTETA